MDYMLEPPYTAADAEADAFENWICDLELEQKEDISGVVEIFWDVYNGNLDSARKLAENLIDSLWEQQKKSLADDF